MKIKTFGALRMEYMRVGKVPFRRSVRANYTLEEQKRIRVAFLTLGTKNEVKASEVLTNEK